MFATGAPLLTVWLADLLVGRGNRRAAVLVVVALGLVTTVVDGMPGWGSDFGGPPAIVPAFAVLALLVAGVRLTWRRVLVVAAGTLAVLVSLSVADWLRPAGDRTHLGRFVQTALDGGAWAVVRRKAAQNLAILVKPISLPLPVAAAFVAFVLARPVAWGLRPLQLAYDRSPVLRQGLAAFAVLVALGFAVNDSGAVVPAVAATVALPLLIAVSARALTDATGQPAGGPGQDGQYRDQDRQGATSRRTVRVSRSTPADIHHPARDAGGTSTPSRNSNAVSRPRSPGSGGAAVVLTSSQRLPEHRVVPGST